MTALPERLTLGEASATHASLLSEFRSQSESPWRLDAQALQRFDSSALAVLLDLRREAAASGRVCEFVGLPADLLALARLYGVDDLLTGNAPSVAPA